MVLLMSELELISILLPHNAMLQVNLKVRSYPKLYSRDMCFLPLLGMNEDLNVTA